MGASNMNSLSLTLVENRSTPPVFAVHVAYERRGKHLQRVEKKYRAVNGRWVCTSARLVGWPRKEWGQVPSGQHDKHGRPHTAKRDWLQLRGFLTPKEG